MTPEEVENERKEIEERIDTLGNDRVTSEWTVVQSNLLVSNSLMLISHQLSDLADQAHFIEGAIRDK